MQNVISPGTLEHSAFAPAPSTPAVVSSVATLNPPVVGIAADSQESLPPILVAEDDADDTFFIQRLIKKTGAKNPVKVFDDGTEVVNYLNARAHSMSPAARSSPIASAANSISAILSHDPFSGV